MNENKSFLTFNLGDEVFAANVSKVLNILEMVKVTKVPQAPAYMKGVINLRGQVLPLIDTRLKFGMKETEYNVNTCILVLDIHIQNESVQLGALVDAVLEVIEIEDKDIQPAPSIGSKYKSEFIEGVVQIKDDFVMLLNMDLIFSVDDIIDLNSTLEKKEDKKKEKEAKEKKTKKSTSGNLEKITSEVKSSK
ncbi:MAG: chemotaxis protein CheW [Bacteroidales bacterium]|nr:chemotaxis protein CheW [Bacteroidales bacterium]